MFSIGKQNERKTSSNQYSWQRPGSERQNEQFHKPHSVYYGYSQQGTWARELFRSSSPKADAEFVELFYSCTVLVASLWKCNWGAGGHLGGWQAIGQTKKQMSRKREEWKTEKMKAMALLKRATAPWGVGGAPQWCVLQMDSELHIYSTSGSSLFPYWSCLDVALVPSYCLSRNSLWEQEAIILGSLQKWRKKSQKLHGKVELWHSLIGGYPPPLVLRLGIIMQSCSELRIWNLV